MQSLKSFRYSKKGIQQQSRNINIFGFDLFGGKKKEPKLSEIPFQEKTFEQKKDEIRSKNKLLQGVKRKELPAKHIIAISSGKGGVGKSTCAVNIACALAKMGLKVGLMDGDLHSPSIPTMMNLRNPVRQIIFDEEKSVEMMLPPENYGIKCMSVGFLKEEGKAIIWKGPLGHYFIGQMIDYVKWGQDGELDYLIVDFPPGTGDTQLSLCQLLNFECAIIVTTPQDIALYDVQRGIDMFFHLTIPVFGIVENMSHYQCSKCDHKEYIFGDNGSKKLKIMDKQLPPIAQIPLHISVRENSDNGTPIVMNNFESPISQAYHSIANTLHVTLQNRAELNSKNNTNSKGPTFVVE